MISYEKNRKLSAKKQNMAKKKTRNIRGLGSLYKRCSNGKDYPPTSKKAGVFWLKYVENGKRYRIPLEVDGKPVMNHDMAKVEQLRLRAPSLSGINWKF